MISYPIAAALAGLAARSMRDAPRRRALWTGFLWGCAALAVIYTLGTVWLAVVAGLPPAVAVVEGVAPFVVFDIVKVALATLVAVGAAPAIAPSQA